jgi:predicted nucleic acid-binding protein
MRALLDTSVLIGAEAPGDLEGGAVSAAREWGRLAATANVAGVPLLTRNAGDFGLIDDLVDVRTP